LTPQTKKNMYKAESLSFPTIWVGGSRTESSYRSMHRRKRVEVVFSLDFEVTWNCGPFLKNTKHEVIPTKGLQREILASPQNSEDSTISIEQWSGFKQEYFGVDPGCCRCVHVTVIMERHPILICRFKLSPAPSFSLKNWGGGFLR
jgi:hypothetical protein